MEKDQDAAKRRGEERGEKVSEREREKMIQAVYVTLLSFPSTTVISQCICCVCVVEEKFFDGRSLVRTILIDVLDATHPSSPLPLLFTGGQHIQSRHRFT